MQVSTSKDDVLTVATSGPVAPEALADAVALCQGAGQAMDRFVRQSLEARLATVVK